MGYTCSLTWTATYLLLVHVYYLTHLTLNLSFLFNTPFTPLIRSEGPYMFKDRRKWQYVATAEIGAIAVVLAVLSSLVNSNVLFSAVTSGKEFHTSQSVT